MAKKRILLNWMYDRADLMAPFIDLREKIDFVLVFYKMPIGIEHTLPFKVVFWDDFSSPYKLLKEVSPDEVVFFNIDDAPYQVALNMACQAKGISTVICDHALRGWSDLPPFKIDYTNNKHNSLRFLFTSLTKDNLHLFPKLCKLLLYKLQSSYSGRTGAELRLLRRPSRYICYTAAGAKYFIERDGAKREQFSIVGIPALDDFFSIKDTSFPPTENYFLLIDQPFVKNRFGNTLLTIEQKNNFLKKLATFCESVNQKLLVKLHPEDYGQDYYITHPLIEYVEEANMPALLHKSSGVFGFYSTFLVPAIYYKKCYVFKLVDVPVQTLWADLGVVKMLDFFAFTPADIHFDSLEIPPTAMASFINSFIYKPDGQSFLRLRHALLA